MLLGVALTIQNNETLYKLHIVFTLPKVVGGLDDVTGFFFSINL